MNKLLRISAIIGLPFLLVSCGGKSTKEITLTFEPPSLPGGSTTLDSYSEQGFSFTGDLPTSFYHTDFGLKGRPYSDGAYLTVARYFTKLQSDDSTPFTLKSVELAEYSTVFAYPQDITFNCYFSDGEYMPVTFSIDGVINVDSPGDFEKFEFSDSCKNAIRVDITPMATIDNMVIEVPINNETGA